MKRRVALVSLLFVTLLVSAAPAAQEIAWPGTSWTLIVPVGSPLKFRGWNQDGDGDAKFDGRFVLTGEFALTTTENCERSTLCLQMDIEPDPPIAVRLPHLKNGGQVWITITNEGQLVRSISSPEQRSALLAGKLQSVTGRTSIVVDQFRVGGDCEQVWYSARFVSFAKPPTYAQTEFGGGFGCGY